MSAVERITLRVCCDNAVIRDGLMAALTPYEDFDCRVGLGVAPAPGNATVPDVIVADHAQGMALAGSVAAAVCPPNRPRILIVALTARECDIRAALFCGVKGYVVVDDAPAHLAPAIRAVSSGARALSPQAAAHRAEHVAAEALTEREQFVLGLVVEGLCNKSIATRMGIAAGTVKSHLRSAFGKLGVASRTQAIAIAHRRGLVQH